MKSQVLITILLLVFTSISSVIFVSAGVNEDQEIQVLNGDLPLNPPQDEFPMFRGDPANTGNVSMDGPSNYDLKWSVGLGGYCSPVVKYDQIYVSSSRRVWCYDLNGTNLWSFYTGDVHWNTPIVVGGRIYVTGNSSRLWCLDANATGSGTTTNYWTFTPDDYRDGCTSSPTTDGTRIFYNFETDGKGMVAVWTANGSLAWNASLDGSMDIESSPSYSSGLVYTGAGNSYSRGSDYLYCFYANNGTLKWKYDVGRPVCSSPAIEYGRVYFGAQDRRVYCLDAVGTHGSTTFYWSYALTANVISSPAVAYGNVYVGDSSSRNAYMYSLDAFGSGGTTTRNWWVSLSPPGGYGVCSSPVVSPNYIYVGTSGNAFYCLNRSSGRSVFSENYTGGDWGISSSPAVFSGLVAYTSDNGNLYVVEQKLDMIPPQVNSTSPADDETDVPVDVNITIEFNEDIEIATITTENIHLNKVGAEIEIYQGYDPSNHTVWLKPVQNLSKETRYSVTVEYLITDLASNHLDGDGDGIQEGDSDKYFFDFWTIPYSEPIITLDSLRALEDERKVVRLRDHISDEDTPFDELIIAENSTYAEIELDELILLYPQGVTYDLMNLTVQDNVNTVYREIEVLITGENDPPLIQDLLPIQPTEEIDFVLNLTDMIFDADGDDLIITCSSPYSVTEGFLITFNYPEGVIYEEVVITVSDGLESDLSVLQVNVTPVNDAPVIDDVSGLTGDYLEVEVDEDDVLVLVVHTSDVDGPLVLLVLEDNLERLVFEPGNGRLTYSPIQEDVGSYSITITAHDGDDMYLKDSVTINITVHNVNDPPVGGEIELVSGGNENFTVLVRTSIATDEDMDQLNYTWDWGDGSSEEGSIEMEHTYGTAGTYTINLVITDGIDSDHKYIIIDVTAPPDQPDDDDIDDDDAADDDIVDDDVVDDDEQPDNNEDDGVDPLLYILIPVLILMILIVIAAVIFMGIKTRREVWEDTEDPDAFLQIYSRTVREVEE